MRGDMPFFSDRDRPRFSKKKNQNKEIYKNWCNAALWISLSGFPCQTRSVTVPRFGFFHRFTDKGTVPLGRLSKKRALNEVKSRKKNLFLVGTNEPQKKIIPN